MEVAELKSMTEIIERIRDGAGWNESLKVLVVMTVLSMLACAMVTHGFAVSPAMREAQAGLEPYFPIINNMAKSSWIWNIEIVKAQATIGVLSMLLMLAMLVLFGPRLRHVPEWDFRRLLIGVFILFPFALILVYVLIHGPFDVSHTRYVSRGERLKMIFDTSRAGTSIVIAIVAALTAIMAKIAIMFPGKIVFTVIQLSRKNKNAK